MASPRFGSKMQYVLSPRFRRWAEILALIAATLCLLSLLYFTSKSSISSVQRFNALYNFPLYGACFLWLRCRLRENPVVHLTNVTVDAVAVAMAASRMFGEYLPSSGHTLLFSYSLLTVANHYYRILAATLLLLTIAAKLNFGDGRSWVYGILVGGALAFLYRRLDGAKPVAK